MDAAADGGLGPIDLSRAFDAFTTAASQLEYTHRELHDEVSRLRRELAERNRELAQSLDETERIRIFLRSILEELPCGICVLDTGSRMVTLANPAAQKLLGGAPDAQMHWSDMPESVLSGVMPVASERQQEEEQEFCLGSGPATRWIAVRRTRPAMALPDSVDRANSLILIIRDVTSRRLAEQERERTRRAMALAEISTVLAHEMRNPLGSLELLAGLLARDVALGSEQRQWVQNIQAGLRMLAATVNNVLNFHSTGSPRLVPVSLARILREESEFVLPLAMQRGVVVTLEEHLGELEIMGDPGGLHQVLLNLTCNALRHTSTGGSIKILASTEQRQRNRYAVVSFVDSGSGISREDLPHIFEPGFSTTGQSPGLGLAVCQRIMQQHQGNIRASSEPGRGTTFELEFPIL